MTGLMAYYVATVCVLWLHDTSATSVLVVITTIYNVCLSVNRWWQVIFTDSVCVKGNAIGRVRLCFHSLCWIDWLTALIFFTCVWVRIESLGHRSRSRWRSKVKCYKTIYSVLLWLLNDGRSKKGKGSPYSITQRRVPELIPVLGSQPAGDVSHKPGGRLPLLSDRPAVTPATLKKAATNFDAWWTEAWWVWTVC